MTMSEIFHQGMADSVGLEPSSRGSIQPMSKSVASPVRSEASWKGSEMGPFIQAFVQLDRSSREQSETGLD